MRRNISDIDTEYSCILGEGSPETILHSETLTYEIHPGGIMRQIHDAPFDPSAGPLNLNDLFQSIYDLKREREKPLAVGATGDNTWMRLAQLTTLEDSGLVPDGELGNEHAYIKHFIGEAKNDEPMSDEEMTQICLDTATARAYEKTGHWKSQFRRLLMLQKLGLYDSYCRYYFANP